MTEDTGIVEPADLGAGAAEGNGETPCPPPPGKNIVVCCDGTGNEPRASANTNVFEVAGLARQPPTAPQRQQVVYYDPGLGTDSAPGAQTWIAKKTTKGLGLAFGYGLRKNIGDAYSFLMEHYEPGDRIYMFGFSRGAYTVRAIAGMLRAVGLMHRGCINLLPYALKLYLAQGGERQWELEGNWKTTFCRRVPKPGTKDELWFTIPVQFLGVWDTVKSVGLARRSVVLPYTDSLPNVLNGRHAVSLDERRSKFGVDLWSASGDICGELRTAWFSGVHSDVGGGYAADERGIADLSLEWMLDGAERAGMLFDRQALKDRHERKIGPFKLPLAKKMVKAHADDEAWKKVRSKVKRAKNWTPSVWEAFDAEPLLRAAAKKIEEDASADYEKVHESFKGLWWALGSSRRKLPLRAWLHWSVKRSFLRGQRSRVTPVGLLSRLKDGTRVVRDGAVVLVERGDGEAPGDVLVQTLTPEESTHLGDRLPEEPEAALQALRLAGIKAWREDCLKRIPDFAKEKIEEAEKHLKRVESAIKEGRFKGRDGALDQLAGFLRKTTIRAVDDKKIAATAPGLMDSLSEGPVDKAEEIA